MADEIALAMPIIVGLIGVVFAILDRGYKRFKEEQSQNPQLVFGGTYLLNFLVSAGIGSVVVTTILPAIVAGVSGISAGGITALAILQFVFGYTTAYTALSKMNTSTERKIELLQAEKKLTKAEIGSLDATKDSTTLTGGPKDK